MTDRPHEISRVVALMNQKGGVGKTTTTVNLAAAIAASGRPTLVVDMDPQAHATLHLGVEPGSKGPSLYDALHDPSTAASAVVEARAGLGLLPAEVDLAAAESELADAADGRRRLAKALEPLGARYEFILIDCPPSLGLLTLNALAAAREVLVPMQAHFLALQGLGKLLETVRLTSAKINPSLRVSGVVLCNHDEQLSHSREIVADLRGFFEQSREQDVPWRGARLYSPPVRRHIKLAECPSFGQTIFEYAPAKAGAEDYQALADAMIAEWDLMLERRRAPGGQTTPPVTVRAHEAPATRPS